MTTFRITKELDAPIEDAWRLLADFGQIARWNTQLIDSYIHTGPERGVGATRRCILQNGKRIEERVVNWDEGRGIDMVNQDLPRFLESLGISFRLSSTGADASRVELTLRFTARGIWKLDTPIFAMILRRNLNKVLEDYKRQLEYEVKQAQRRPLVETIA